MTEVVHRLAYDDTDSSACGIPAPNERCTYRAEDVTCEDCILTMEDRGR